MNKHIIRHASKSGLLTTDNALQTASVSYDTEQVGLFFSSI